MIFPDDFFCDYSMMFPIYEFRNFSMISIESNRNHRKMMKKSWKIIEKS